MIEKAEEPVVEATGIEQQDGLLVKPEGVPGEDFEKFLEGAEASGERDEGIGSLTDKSLARVHGVGDVKLGDAVVGHFEINQHLGDDADDFTAGGKGCFSGGAHEADFGSAVDEANVVFSQGTAKVFGCFAIDGVGSVGGGAEDGYILDHSR